MTGQPQGELSLSRLRWQCRRGMLELDLLLQTFVETVFSSLSFEEQATFRELLRMPDQELLELLMGLKAPDNKDVADVAAKIRQAAAG
jgi:antitoxin CptB